MNTTQTDLQPSAVAQRFISFVNSELHGRNSSAIELSFALVLVAQSLVSESPAHRAEIARQLARWAVEMDPDVWDVSKQDF